MPVFPSPQMHSFSSSYSPLANPASVHVKLKELNRK
jgi:hypothetical protein